MRRFLSDHFAKFRRDPLYGASNTGGVYKFRDFLSSRPRSSLLGRNQGCHKGFLRVKNIPRRVVHGLGRPAGWVESGWVGLARLGRDLAVFDGLGWFGSNMTKVGLLYF